MKNLTKEKISYIVLLVLSALSYLVPLFPIVYTSTSGHIEPIMGYRLFAFLQDISNTNLYYGTIAFMFYLVLMGIVFIFSLGSFLIKDDKHRFQHLIFTFIFLGLVVVSSITMTVFYSKCKSSNIFLNIGAYCILGYSVISFIVFLILSIIKRKDDKQI